MGKLTWDKEWNKWTKRITLDGLKAIVFSEDKDKLEELEDKINTNEEKVSEVIIRTVLRRKDGIKMVIIPKKSKIKKRQQVLVTNDLTLINKFLEEEKDGKN